MRALIHIKLFASRQFSEAFNVKPKKLRPNGFAIKQTTMERRFVTCHIATKSPVERRPGSDGAIYDRRRRREAKRALD